MASILSNSEGWDPTKVAYLMQHTNVGNIGARKASNPLSQMQKSEKSARFCYPLIMYNMRLNKVC